MIFGIEADTMIIRYKHNDKDMALIASRKAAERWMRMADRDGIEYEARLAWDVLQQGW